jgi:hypothetical protein
MHGFVSYNRCYQIREATPLKPRWEADDIVLENQLTLTNHKVLSQDDNVMRME